MTYRRSYHYRKPKKPRTTRSGGRPADDRDRGISGRKDKSPYSHSSTAYGRSSSKSRRNAPPKYDSRRYNPHGVRFGFGDGPSSPATPSNPANPTNPATQQPTVPTLPSWAKPGMNLENNLPYAQGSHSESAQGSSISSLISSLLVQSQTDAQDFWKVWGADKGANLNQAMNNSMGAFGVNTLYNAVTGNNQASILPANPDNTNTNPNIRDRVKQLKEQYGKDWYKHIPDDLKNDIREWRNKNDKDWGDRYDRDNRYRRYTDRDGYDHDHHRYKDRDHRGHRHNRHSNDDDYRYRRDGNRHGTNKWGDPNADLGGNMGGGSRDYDRDYDRDRDRDRDYDRDRDRNNYGSGSSRDRDRDDDRDSRGRSSRGGSNNPTSGKDELPLNPIYNPWSKGQGGDYNRHGPTPQQMLQPTMEALSLANAYFAPQRMELAYQLGDMETDMRKLAVNLGRQVDDPILQAKLHKDAMQAVRTLDVQQNTFAFQMAEQRRREETQNFQFYDNLAQNEHKLMLANQQFYDDLELRAMQLKMQNEQFNASLDMQGYQTQLANRQFYDNLDIQRRYYNLQNWQVANAANPLGGGATPAPPTAPLDAPQQQTISGLFNSMFGP